MGKEKKAGAALSETVGKNIQACRKRTGLTQNQLAQELGIEVETVSRYERGIVAPSFSQLENICNVFEIPPWLLFSDGSFVPDVQAMTITELLKGLSSRNKEFVLQFAQTYAQHHHAKKKP